MTTTVDAGVERVAVQAAVLAALRQATGGRIVWPWSAMDDLGLSPSDAVVTARTLAGDLRLTLTTSDLTGAKTVEALVDRAVDRATIDARSTA
jgi:hypothetical protein